jgi:hypothetical protein
VFPILDDGDSCSVTLPFSRVCHSEPASAVRNVLYAAKSRFVGLRAVGTTTVQERSRDWRCIWKRSPGGLASPLPASFGSTWKWPGRRAESEGFEHMPEKSPDHQTSPHAKVSQSCRDGSTCHLLCRLHNFSPYKISSVHTAFALQALIIPDPAVPPKDPITHYPVKSYRSYHPVSAVGMFRALVQFGREMNATGSGGYQVSEHKFPSKVLREEGALQR